MAKKYSASDIQKMKQDLAADFRAKGADVRQIHTVNEGGTVAGLKQLRNEMSSVVDQSQESDARGREKRS